ncbi:paraquat-inducible protein A [Microbulbifer agarilyticus]|uniref:paraquat-inducible protein A n=1 Tax=Microbulbifer agarilyticus TaxID=260552 RepID=UPI001CD54157|nr:paraquat-inducible protein A [Microbulbifer agarilyticus]MCA0892698.1 paraquat-inducible protein A [Microbulbifer agarilyticus]
MNRPARALSHGFWTCLGCRQLVRVKPATHTCFCPRCGARMHGRVEASLMLTWALTITGALLLIPANVLPVMTVIYLGAGDPSTIISGVFELYHAGFWGIALIVFIASIAVPVMKLVGLVILCLVVQLRLNVPPRQSMRIYRVVSAIGRWSLLDLFMISILVALVDMGAIAEVAAGPGSTAFATVVIVTMFAVRAFDPRLVWDVYESKKTESAAQSAPSDQQL